MHVFVYGTLTDPEQARRVLETVEYGCDAVLDGLHRVDRRYPTLAPGGEVAGRLLQTDEMTALDRYEGVGQGLYVRVSVPTVATDRLPETVDCYVGDPTKLDAPVDWPGTGPVPERIHTYLETNSVQVRPL